MSEPPTPGAPPPPAASSPPPPQAPPSQDVSFFFGHRTWLHVVLAVLTFGLWLLVLLAIYLWRKGRKGWSVATAAVLGLFVLLIGIGAATPTEDKTTATQTTETQTTETETTEETTEQPPPPPPPPATPQESVTQALGSEVAAGGYAGDVQINDVSFGGGEVSVFAQTPEGGLQGVSCGDLEDGAAAIFETIYNDGGWNGSAVVAFKGGLVSTATGEELPNVNTGIFTMPAGQAQRINWANEDALLNIDWTLYRDFCHPALQ